MSFNTILTAAHCFQNKDPGRYVVIPGLHDITTSIWTSQVKKHKIFEVKMETDPMANDDLAIVTVDPPFDFSTSKVQKVEMNLNSMPGLM